VHDPRIVYSARDVAMLFGCRPQTARRMIRQGLIPGRRLGRRVVVLRDELETVLRRLEPVRRAD
jgi:Helix-turn-helix domain